MRCVAKCVHGARETVGHAPSMDEIVHELTADQLFFESSGGGVTISGGDPLMFPEFCLHLSRLLKAKGIHVAMETSGFSGWKAIEPFLNWIDLFIVDLKTLDPRKHLQTIGCPLANVQEVIDGLIVGHANLRLHVPVIPGFNNTEHDFQLFADYIQRFAARLDGVDILPYHCYGTAKYKHLGINGTYMYKGVEDLPESRVKPLALALQKIGVPEVTIGGLGKTDNRENRSPDDA
jgi:pyruvate formate lyase activating enzyme